MKNIAILLCIIGFLNLSCSTSPQIKAEKLIKDRLKETLHDWNSYELVKFGELDSLYTTRFDVPEYVKAISKYQRFENLYKESESEFWLFKGESVYAKQGRQKSIDESKKFLDSMGLCAKEMIKIEDNFVPEFKGWIMAHTYRANNANGNKVIDHYLYYFDKDLTKIINIEDMSISNNNVLLQ